MSAPAETTLFVASACGTCFEPLPRSEILHRLTAQQFHWSQQVWCPDDQRWKQAREVKRLTKAASSLPNPRVIVRPPSIVQTSPRLEQKDVPHLTSREVHGKSAIASPIAFLQLAPILTWLRRSSLYYGIGCLFVIGTLAAMNWFAAEKPVREVLAMTKLDGETKINAHFRFFVQPNILVVQISKLPQRLSGDGFIDLLTDIASKTATIPLLNITYHGVDLVKEGETKFVLRGEAWKELAAMRVESSRYRAMFLINNLYLSGGQVALNQSEDRMEYLYFLKEQTLRNFLGTFLNLEKDPLNSI